MSGLKLTSAGMRRSSCSYDENQTAFRGNSRTVFLPAFAPPGSRNKSNYRSRTKVACSLDPFYQYSQYTEVSEDETDEEDPDCMSIGTVRAIIKEHLVGDSGKANNDHLRNGEQKRESNVNGAPLSLLQLTIRYNEHHKKFEKEEAANFSKGASKDSQLFHSKAGRSIADIVHGAAMCTFDDSSATKTSLEDSFKIRLEQFDRNGMFKKSTPSVVQQPQLSGKDVAQARLQPLSVEPLGPHHSGLVPSLNWGTKRSASLTPQNTPSGSVSTLQSDASPNLKSTDTPATQALLQSQYLPIPGYLQQRVFSPLPLAQTLPGRTVSNSNPQPRNASTTNGNSSTTQGKNRTTPAKPYALPKLVIVPHCASYSGETEGSDDDESETKEDINKMATMNTDQFGIRWERNTNGTSGVPSLSREMDIHRINLDSSILQNNGIRLKYLFNKPLPVTITSASSSNQTSKMAAEDVNKVDAAKDAFRPSAKAAASSTPPIRRMSSNGEVSRGLVDTYCEPCKITIVFPGLGPG